MSAMFGENRIFQQAYSLPPVGHFALDAEPPKAPHWDHCREQFAQKFDPTVPGFYYSTHPARREDVAEFLVKCEEIINIDQHSTFNNTEKNTVLWIAPSRFWTDCDMKRSFLTMVLRCGLNYDRVKDNFDEAMFSDDFKENKWARETRNATMRFLFGFTRWMERRAEDSSAYLNSKHGWHEEFCKIDKDSLSVRKKLALPDGEVREASIIGVESLWA